MTSPYPASLIALVFVKKGIEEGYPVTQMKLQKMVYFAQGVHLALHKEPLISEIFHAWKYGPVVPAIYSAYSFYGSSPITDTHWAASIHEDNVEKIDGDAVKTIEYTWDILKQTNAVKLSNWTHKDGSPWSQVYVENVKETPIPNQAIQAYFETFLEPAS
ncbi:MAG: type II toxin-antitoxin system antitoxin SocA domain-containing protein [Bacteroidota bacterium]